MRYSIFRALPTNLHPSLNTSIGPLHSTHFTHTIYKQNQPDDNKNEGKKKVLAKWLQSVVSTLMTFWVNEPTNEPTSPAPSNRQTNPRPWKKIPHLPPGCPVF